MRGSEVTNEEKALEALDDCVKDLEAKLAAARAAIAAFGRVPVPKGLALVKGGKAKRKLSAAGRAAIAKASRRRWAAYRKAQAGR